MQLGFNVRIKRRRELALSQKRPSNYHEVQVEGTMCIPRLHIRGHLGGLATGHTNFLSTRVPNFSLHFFQNGSKGTSIKGACCYTSLLPPTQVYSASLPSKRFYSSTTTTQQLLSQQILRVNNQNKIRTRHTKIHLDLTLPNSKDVSLPGNRSCQEQA